MIEGSSMYGASSLTIFIVIAILHCRALLRHVILIHCLVGTALTPGVDVDFGSSTQPRYAACFSIQVAKACANVARNFFVPSSVTSPSAVISPGLNWM